MPIDNYDSKHVVLRKTRKIFYSIWRQSEAETRRLSRSEKRKSYLRFFLVKRKTRRRRAYIGYSSRLDGVK